MRRRALGVVAACWLGTAAPAAAQSSGTGSEAVRLDLGGYVRSISGASDRGFDVPTLDRRAAFNGEVVRFKWLVEIGDHVRINVHNRFQLQLSSSSTPEAGSVGFGVSRAPRRTIDLSSSLISESHLTAVHDLDRLAFSVYTGIADITAGRQAITWGISSIFPVADLWAQFSPFELDTEEKPGVDAVRALAYPADGLELDLVIADRGDGTMTSAGIRATRETTSADLYVAAAKSWRELVALAGATVVTGSWRVRAEVAAPWDLDRSEATPPRFTLGADRIGTTWQWSFEYHYNGFGTDEPRNYALRLVSPAFARGQTYYVGRHLVGAAAGHQFTDRLAGALTTLANVQDPSGAFIPALNYDAGQNLRFSLGALLSAGARPTTVPGPLLVALRSEFGAYGNSLFGIGSFYF